MCVISPNTTVVIAICNYVNKEIVLARERTGERFDPNLPKELQPLTLKIHPALFDKGLPFKGEPIYIVPDSEFEPRGDYLLVRSARYCGLTPPEVRTPERPTEAAAEQQEAAPKAEEPQF